MYLNHHSCLKKKIEISKVLIFDERTKVQNTKKVKKKNIQGTCVRCLTKKEKKMTTKVKVQRFV